MKKNKPKIAYFSMEFALGSKIPTYAGGLGVLATDLLRSAADLEIPMIGVSLTYHQSEHSEKAFDPSKYFEEIKSVQTILQIEDRQVKIRAWKHETEGISGFKVPLYLLDTFLPQNDRWDRDLTKHLYDTNQYTRLCQEAILGIGGLRMLRALGHDDIDVFHMNEGHASLLTLERLREEMGDQKKVIDSCVFTTHTPVPAGHDRFPYSLAKKTLGPIIPENIKELASEDELHTTRLALNMSHRVNAVSKKHAEVCAKMFPGYRFSSVTNGVHHLAWSTEPIQTLFDQHLPSWRQDPNALSVAVDLPDEAVKKARQANKKALIDYVNQHPEFLVHSSHELEKDDYFDEKTLTMTFSRRFVPYKRPLLLFKDPDRLRDIGYKKIQIIYSGLCHPDDQFCNDTLKKLQHLQKELRGQIRLAVMPSRNLDNTKILAAGSDVWLNNPEPPMEACGTSGMKAALNGALNFSTLDGWWIEATEMQLDAGWACGCDESGHDEWDCNEIYATLNTILETYYNKPEKWLKMIKKSMSLAGHFNTHRNVKEYMELMWKKT